LAALIPAAISEADNLPLYASSFFLLGIKT
jgi:hypothetical protein